MKSTANRVAPRTYAGAMALVLTLVRPARADVLLTTDGRATTGTVRIDGQSLRADAGPAVAIGDVLAVTLDHRTRTGPQSVVLADGTTLAGRIEGIDEKSVRVTTAAVGTVAVPVDRVARVCFTPVSGDLLAKVPTEASGLLLRDGDFFEGVFHGFDGRSVTMASPLLGEASFAVADRAAAIVLRPAGRTDRAAWVVRTTDGSVLATTSAVPLVDGRVRLDVAGVGSVAVPWADVVDVRAGGDRVVSLCDERPSDGVATVDRTTIGLPSALVGGPVGRSVWVAAGSSVTYRLDGRFAAFACRAGVPAGVVPIVPERWAVRVDGRAAAGGGPRTSVDDPAQVAVPLAAATELTLSVDAAAGGGGMLFAEPALVRGGNPATRPTPAPTSRPASPSQG